jgi:hypothetical protein
MAISLRIKSSSRDEIKDFLGPADQATAGMPDVAFIMGPYLS